MVATLNHILTLFSKIVIYRKLPELAILTQKMWHIWFRFEIYNVEISGVLQNFFVPKNTS